MTQGVDIITSCALWAHRSARICRRDLRTQFKGAVLSAVALGLDRTDLLRHAQRRRKASRSLAKKTLPSCDKTYLLPCCCILSAVHQRAASIPFHDKDLIPKIVEVR